MANTVMKMDSQQNKDAEVGVQRIVHNFNRINEIQTTLKNLEKLEPSIKLTKDQALSLKTKDQLDDLLRQLEAVEELTSALRESKKRVCEEILNRKNYIDSTLSRRRSSGDIEYLLDIPGRRSYDIESELGLSRRRSSFSNGYEAGRRSFGIESEAGSRSFHFDSNRGKDYTLAKPSDPGCSFKHRQRRVHFTETDRPDCNKTNRFLHASNSRLQSEKPSDCNKSNRTEILSVGSNQIKYTGSDIHGNAALKRMKASPVHEIKKEFEKDADKEAETEDRFHVNGYKKRSFRAQNKKKGDEEAEVEKQKNPKNNGDSNKKSPGGQGKRKKNLARRLSKVFASCLVCGFALYLSRAFARCIVCKSKKPRKLKQKERL